MRKSDLSSLNGQGIDKAAKTQREAFGVRMDSEPIIGSSLACCKQVGQKYFFNFFFLRNNEPQQNGNFSSNPTFYTSQLSSYSLEEASSCSVPYCKQCGAVGCTACQDGFFLKGSTDCFTVNNFPIGYGLLNPTAAAIDVCTVKYCGDCRPDRSTCISCRAGYTLVSATCVRSIELQFEQDVTFVQAAADLNVNLLVDSSLQMMPPEVWSQLAARELSAGCTLEFFKDAVKQPEVEVRSEYSLVKPGAVKLLAYFYKVPDLKSLQVRFQCDAKHSFAFADTTYIIISKPLEFTWESQTSGIKAFENTGKSIGVMSGSTDSYGGAAFFTVLMSLDPTGLFLKFAQVLKIFNKIRFFHINFGVKLSSFLDQIGDVFKTLGDPKEMQILDVKNSVGYRGNISKKKVGISFASLFADKIPIYLVSWALIVANTLIAFRRIKVPLFYVKAMFLHQKLHLIIFGIMNFDVLFYGSRSLLHIRTGLLASSALAVICYFLVLADFCLLYRAAMDTKAWQVVFNRKQYQLRLKLQLNQQAQPAEEESAEYVNKETDQKDKEKKEDEKKEVKRVDYKLTYDEYFTDNARIELLSSMLRLDKGVYNSGNCRCFELICMVRIGIYQVLVVSAQYMSGLMILILAVTELLKIKIVVQEYTSRKFLNSVVILLAQLTQSLFILLFLILCFLYHFQSFKQYVTEGSQSFGVMIIFLAFIIEWVLAVTGLVVNLFIPLICKRKEKNPPAYELIKYLDPKENKGETALKPEQGSELLEVRPVPKQDPFSEKLSESKEAKDDESLHSASLTNKEKHGPRITFPFKNKRKMFNSWMDRLKS